MNSWTLISRTGSSYVFGISVENSLICVFYFKKTMFHKDI